MADAGACSAHVFCLRPGPASPPCPSPAAAPFRHWRALLPNGFPILFPRTLHSRHDAWSLVGGSPPHVQSGDARSSAHVESEVEGEGVKSGGPDAIGFARPQPKFEFERRLSPRCAPGPRRDLTPLHHALTQAARGPWWALVGLVTGGSSTCRPTSATTWCALIPRLRAVSWVSPLGRW